MPVLIVTGLGLVAIAAAILGAQAEPQSGQRQITPQQRQIATRHVEPSHFPGDYTIPAGTTFSVSTTQLSVGESFTVSGNNCPVSEPVEAPFLEGDGYTREQTPIVRNQDGTWEATPTVPIGVWGATTLEAMCGGNPTQELFTYPQVYHVFISSPYALQVTPSGTVAPGTTLSVTPTASFCSTDDTITVGVGTVPSESSDSPFESPLGLVAVDAQLDEPTSEYPVISDVPWHATLTIPNQVNGGQYFVTAACMADNRGFPGSYASQPITITSSGLAAVTPLSNKDLVSRKDLPGGWELSHAKNAPLPGCFVQALSSVYSVASVRRTLVRSHGPTVSFEDITSYADTLDAYTSITNALAQCTMVLSTSPSNGSDQPAHDVREYPAIAPTFFGSEGFLDQWTNGRTRQYRALVLIRRTSSLVEVAVADTGSPDISLVHRLVSEALRHAPH